MLRLKQTGLPLEAVTELDKDIRQFFSLPLERKKTFGYPGDKYVVPLGGTYPKGRRYMIQSSFEGKDGEQNLVNEWFIYRSNKPSDEWQNRSTDPYYSSSRGKLFYKETEEGDYTFPDEVPHLEASAERYYHEMEDLASKVMRAFALSLNVSEDFFLKKCRRGAEWPVTIAHYPSTEGKQDMVPPGTMRINPHWDRDLFALVVMPPSQPYSESNALQRLTDSQGNGVDGRSNDVHWTAVPLQKGEVLVNLGELMARYSNGRFKHVVHQVPNQKEGQSRLTFMAYVRPNYDQIVEPIHVVDEPQYTAVPVGLVATYDNPNASDLYDQCAREKLRLAQGMYDAHGSQGAVRFPSHTHAVDLPGCPKYL
jgi:isopenicillin N synthase-like dioxygenase